MWVQKIPEFHSGHILKQKTMVGLPAYPYHLRPLLYRNCTDGIISGCTLTTVGDSIVVNSGVIRYESEFYLIRGPQLIHHILTNITRVLSIVLHDQVQTDSSVTRKMELAFTEGVSSETCYLELCRSKLQSDARLRYTYTSFADRETEYDTLNTIHAPFRGIGWPTLLPEITAHLTRGALAAGADGIDVLFCMILLSPKEPAQAEALEAYIQSKQGAGFSCGDSLRLYQGLIACLKQPNGDRRAASAKRKSWSIMMD